MLVLPVLFEFEKIGYVPVRAILLSHQCHLQCSGDKLIFVCALKMTCGHQCPNICHHGPCVDQKKCEKKVIIRCACKRKKKDLRCSERQDDEQLQCDEICEKIQTEKKEVCIFHFQLPSRFSLHLFGPVLFFYFLSCFIFFKYKDYMLLIAAVVGLGLMLMSVLFVTFRRSFNVMLMYFSV